MINKIKPISFGRAYNIKKGWGEERIITNHIVLDEPFPTGYSGKLLIYNKKGALSSAHIHHIKSENFFVIFGSFEFRYYNLETGDQLSKVLVEGDVVDIPPGNPHQLLSMTDSGTIIEFASTDYAWDNYRIGKGDSQTRPTEHNGYKVVSNMTRPLEESLEYAKKQRKEIRKFKIDAPTYTPKEGEGFRTQNKI